MIAYLSTQHYSLHTTDFPLRGWVYGWVDYLPGHNFSELKWLLST